MLTINYLKALEQALPQNITVSYIGIFKNHELVGVALIEHVKLYLKDMFRRSSSSALKRFFKGLLSRVLKGDILVVGNLTHTGQHGIAFIKEKISAREFIEAVLEAIKISKAKIKKESGKTIRIIMFKDYFKDDEIHKARRIFESEKFIDVTVQPNMVLNVRPNWISMEGYFNSLNKKYRLRYKRARRKFGKIDKQELDTETIKNNTKNLYRLYSNVSNNAKFNTFLLPENHFYSLKKELGNNFKVFGYYSNGSLIGFYSLIINNNTLETYFLGYDSKHQYSNQLYLNMLYDMIEFAVYNKLEYIVYARTAMEIKSSVGAKPLSMFMYIKHTNRLANAVLKLVFNFMKPNQRWVERHPFIN